MDLTLDPNTSLEELQTRLFMTAITELIQLARTTDQDHVKLRALTEVARLCNPAKRNPPSDGAEPGRRGDNSRKGASSGAVLPAQSASSGAPRASNVLQQSPDPSPPRNNPPAPAVRP